MDAATANLFLPLIIAVVPIIMAFGKKLIPVQYSALIPVVATALGPALDYGVSWLTGKAADPARGALYGMAGVALREIVDQVKKTVTPDPKA